MNWSDTAMNYMSGAGARAHPVVQLGWGLTAISVAVVVIVTLLVIWGALRERQPGHALPGQPLPVGGRGRGLSWLVVGIGLTIVVLAVSAVWTMEVLAAVAAPPKPASVTIQITGHQWWWEARYAGSIPSDAFTTATELHIPVGEPVRLDLIGGDVIHSFWVPKLAGKTDLIPGQTNHAWIEADQPGTFRGQCGEFCGLEHARMGLVVIAEPRGKFDEWQKAQRAGARVPAADDPTAEGAGIFLARCAACHTVRGTQAGGIVGPDLTHVMSRTTLAAATLPNTIGHRTGWIADPQGVKPGARMPRINLSPEELNALGLYIETLE
jgi:cytochrome c oxidase subunit 2